MKPTAFPAHRSVDCTPGMDLRDYFAAAALASTNIGDNSHDWYEILAARCYAMADAMMKERDKGDKNASE